MGRQDIDPITLFDGNASLYIRLPVLNNESIIRTFTTALIPRLHPDAINMLIEYTDTIYIAVFIQQGLLLRESTYFQLAVQGRFPTVVLNAVLSEKNGWNQIEQTADGKRYSRKTTSFGLELAIPNSNFIFLSNKDVFSMQKRYEQSQPRILDWPSTYNDAGEKINIRLFFDNSDFVTMYIPMAQSLLPILFGIPLELAIEYAVGTIVPYDENTVMLNTQLHMVDSRSTQLAMALFGLATLGVDFIVKEWPNNIIILNDIILDSTFLAGFINQ